MAQSFGSWFLSFMNDSPGTFTLLVVFVSILLFILSIYLISRYTNPAIDKDLEAFNPSERTSLLTSSSHTRVPSPRAMRAGLHDVFSDYGFGEYIDDMELHIPPLPISVLIVREGRRCQEQRMEEWSARRDRREWEERRKQRKDGVAGWGIKGVTGKWGSLTERQTERVVRMPIWDSDWEELATDVDSDEDVGVVGNNGNGTTRLLTLKKLRERARKQRNLAMGVAIRECEASDLGISTF